MFWHPAARIGTPILILRDPTHDILPENWNPRKQTTVPGVLSRNASPYQKSFSGEIKSCGVKMIHHSADWGWSGTITSMQRRVTRRSTLMMRHFSTWCNFHFLHLRSMISDINTFPTRMSKCSAIAWCQKSTAIWYNLIANYSLSLNYLCIVLYTVT